MLPPYRHSISYSLYPHIMAIRSLRRTNPITIVLGAILIFGTLFFLISPSSSAEAITAAKQKFDHAAQHPLSPPTSPFRKAPKSLGGEYAPPPVVRYKMNDVTTTSDPEKNKEQVLILTPLARFYQGYWDNVLKLSYPHALISIGFIIPRGRDGDVTTKALQKAIEIAQNAEEKDRFGSITILRQEFDPPLASQNEAERHKMSNQKARRSAMSKARNALLFTTIGPTTSWILWLDSDIVETPPTLIQDLASHDKPVLVPNCFQRFTNDKGHPDIRPYDYNSWVDSQQAQELAAKMAPDDILLEGYAEMPTFRTLMAMTADTSEARDSQKVIPLDGVGGTALMVKADVHRDGAMFPPFAFYHLMETEGFAKMARRLGWHCSGLPNYFVSFPPCLDCPRGSSGRGKKFWSTNLSFFCRFIITTSKT